MHNRGTGGDAGNPQLRNVDFWRKIVKKNKDCYPMPRALYLAMSVVFLALTAHAQYTPVNLFQYLNTNNNTSGIMDNSFLAQGPDGQLYDTDWSDGTYGYGSVFTISLTGEFELLYSFCTEGEPCQETGANPQGGVTLGSDGNFYGTTTDGGAHGDGTIFKITPSGKLTTLYSFSGVGDDGTAPTFPVIQASNGDFYGVTSSGGTYDNGTFFKITSAGTQTDLASFHCSVNGCNPDLPVQGSDGNFYGTTNNGGPNTTCNCGVVYQATPAGAITVIYTFPSGQGSPLGQLVEGSDGNFWGVTSGVAFISAGELYKISPSGDFTVVHTFAGGSNGDGAGPVSGLIAGSDGNLYGVTNAGGTANVGTIYNVDPSTDAYAVLYSFCGDVSCVFFLPGPVLLQDTNGTFYGNTNGNSDGGSWFISYDTGLGPFVRTITQSGDVGATVTFLGQDFTGTTEVEFDGVDADFDLISETELKATVPAAGATGPVSVITPSGKLIALTNFKVLPKISSFSPPSGPVGTTVTINGTGFTQVLGVGFGNSVPATNLKVVSDIEITADVPSGAKTGPIYVKTKGGTAASSTDFTVTE
jgi:uncharacterized repeat protein (TIGR03803 family)